MGRSKEVKLRFKDLTSCIRGKQVYLREYATDNLLSYVHLEFLHSGFYKGFREEITETSDRTDQIHVLVCVYITAHLTQQPQCW